MYGHICQKNLEDTKKFDIFFLEGPKEDVFVGDRGKKWKGDLIRWGGQNVRTNCPRVGGANYWLCDHKTFF